MNKIITTFSASSVGVIFISPKMQKLRKAPMTELEREGTALIYLINSASLFCAIYLV